MAALALGDEHPPFRDPQILQPQPQDLAAAQPAQHHRRDHRPVPMRPQRRRQRVDLGRGQDPRQRPRRRAPTAPPAADGTAPGGSAAPAAPGSPPHHRGPAGTRTTPTRSTTAGAPSRPTPRPARRPDPPAAARPLAGAAGALRSDERQHVRRLDLRRRLADHREEHLQVKRRRQHRVRPAPPATNSRYSSASGTPAPAASPLERSREQAEHESPACTAASHRHRRHNPSRVSEMTRKITGITCRSGCLGAGQHGRDPEPGCAQWVEDVQAVLATAGPDRRDRLVFQSSCDLPRFLRTPVLWRPWSPGRSPGCLHRTRRSSVVELLSWRGSENRRSLRSRRIWGSASRVCGAGWPGRCR